MIIKTFDSREEAMRHEIELHNKYDVAVNPKFYNKAKATSTGFTMHGVTRDPFTDEHKAKMSANRTGTGNQRYIHDTEYEWIHKSGEVFVGTIEKMVKYSSKDSSSFYKIFKQKLLSASGWRVRKNMTADIETIDAVGHYRRNAVPEDVLASRQASIEANKALKYPNKYLWVNPAGEQYLGNMYQLADLEGKDQAIYRRHITGARATASGWRIVKNMDTGCVTTELNHGKGIKVKLTSEMIK